MTDFLKGAQMCADNAMTLQFSARTLAENRQFYRLAVFMLDTAMEEIAKGLYCIMVHHGWITEESVRKILRVFKIHDPKFLLGHWIPSRLSVKNGELMIDGSSVANLTEQDWSKILAKEKAAAKKYLTERGNRLYVGLDDNDDWSHPKVHSPSEEEIEDRQTRCSLLIGLIHLLLTNTAISSMEGLDFGTQLTTGAPSLDVEINGSRSKVVAFAPFKIPTSSE